MGTSDLWCGGPVSPGFTRFPGGLCHDGPGLHTPLGICIRCVGIRGWRGAGKPPLFHDTVSTTSYGPASLRRGWRGVARVCGCPLVFCSGPCGPWIKGWKPPKRPGVFFSEGCSSSTALRSLGVSGRSGSSELLEKITLTADETALLRQIGQQTKGPRHTMTLWADPRTIRIFWLAWLGSGDRLVQEEVGTRDGNERETGNRARHLEPPGLFGPLRDRLGGGTTAGRSVEPEHGGGSVAFGQDPGSDRTARPSRTKRPG